MSHAQDSAPDDGNAAPSRYQSRLQRFEDALLRGEGPRLEEFLPAEEPDRGQVLVELIHVELECRLKAGEGARVESYLERFPELAWDTPALLDLLAWEYTLHRRKEPALGPAEYVRRFPQHAGPLAARLQVESTARWNPPEHSDTRVDDPTPGPGIPLPRCGNYDLLELVGAGGMAQVYRGRHRPTGQTVAVKLLPIHCRASKDLVKRFEREFQACCLLNHPGIVRGIEAGSTEDTLFFVMEFVDGISVGQHLRQEGPFAEPQAVQVIRQVAEALQYTHGEGFIHRDVKPANILMAGDGRAKLVDLGLIKDNNARIQLQDPDLTATGQKMGTPCFMAPEQYRSAKHVDRRCDIFSLGATLYMMLTGVPPFGSSGPLTIWMNAANNTCVPPRQLNAAISLPTEQAILRSLQADPTERPDSCQEFLAEFLS
jgi:hypothetical protein